MNHELLIMSELELGERYELLTSLIVPRPIAFVSTVSANGIPNLAPFSYFILGGQNPPSLVFSPTTKRESVEKDTLANIKESGEYVINLLTAELAQGMNETAPEFPPDVNEWEYAGFTPAQSNFIKPPRVLESPVSFECKLFHIVSHGEGLASANYVIGEVLAIHLANEFKSVESRQHFPALARLGGSDYLDLGSGKLFQMERPKPSAPASS